MGLEVFVKYWIFTNAIFSGKFVKFEVLNYLWK